MISPGLISRSTSQPSPHFSRVPGRKFSHKMSVFATNPLNRSAPSGRCRSMVTDFLLRASLSQVSVSPRLVGVPKYRHASPPVGCSTFSTSAPNSPRMPAQYGAAITVAASMTRMPESGRSSVCSCVILDDPLLPEPGNLRGRNFKQLAHYFVGCITQRRPQVGDPPRRLGERGNDVGHDHLADPIFDHFRKIA